MRDFTLYEDDSGLWVAEAKEVQGLRVKAKTMDEAIEKIKAALLIYYPCSCEDGDR